MNIDFSMIWFAIIIFATLMYIIADGSDWDWHYFAFYPR